MSDPSPTGSLFSSVRALGSDFGQVARSQARVLQDDLAAAISGVVRGALTIFFALALLALGLPLVLVSAAVFVGHWLGLSTLGSVFVFGCLSMATGVGLLLALRAAISRTSWFERTYEEWRKTFESLVGRAPTGDERPNVTN